MGSEHARVALFGLGGVGRALLELVDERHAPIAIVAAADSRGGIARPIAPRELLELKARGLPDETPARDLIDATAPDVVVDVMSCDFAAGEPSLSLLLEALGAGISAVTANKIPLARAWTKLVEAASSTGARVGYAAAAGAALPAVAVARWLARVDRIERFEGILTGTAQHVLAEMRAGRSFEDAVRGAQDAGIAEPDPSVDLAGWDTAAKCVILANTLWGASLDLDAAAVQGIDRTTHAGPGVALVGTARWRGGVPEVEVAPRSLPSDHPLAGLSGRSKGIVFAGPAVGEVVIAGARSHPRGAAAAVLGDIVELVAPRG